MPVEKGRPMCFYFILKYKYKYTNVALQYDNEDIDIVCHRSIRSCECTLFVDLYHS